MENSVFENSTNQDTWVKPEIKVSQITEETQGGGAAGPDFASEIS